MATFSAVAAARSVWRWLYGRALLVGARVDLVLCGLLIGGAALRVYRLGQPDGALIFDEAYYVQDARVILGLPVSLDNLPSNPHSGLDPNAEHPPLAKLLMAASMYLFGSTAVAWRMPSVVLGVLSIWLIFRIVLRVGGTRTQARLAAFVLTFDNLAFVHGRIATLDIYVLAFALLGTLFYVEGMFELAAVALGVATVCKVNGLFGVVGLVLFEVHRRWRPRPDAAPAPSLRSLASFLGVYLAFTLLLLGALDRAWTEFHGPVDHLKHIVEYGASLRRTGDMQGEESTPIQWWFDEVPINYLRVQATANGITRTIVLFRGAMTEYVIFAAPFALGYAALAAWRGSRLGGLAVALFAANYAPLFFAWLLASRISYIYYALQALPAIALAIASVSAVVPRAARWGFVGAVLLSFVLWFPFRWH